MKNGSILYLMPMSLSESIDELHLFQRNSVIACKNQKESVILFGSVSGKLPSVLEKLNQDANYF
jgi:hypothetical protein